MKKSINISTTDYWLTFTYAFLNTYVEKSVDISETSIVTQNCVYADVKCLEINVYFTKPLY